MLRQLASTIILAGTFASTALVAQSSLPKSATHQESQSAATAQDVPAQQASGKLEVTPADLTGERSRTKQQFPASEAFIVRMVGERSEPVGKKSQTDFTC